MGDLSVQDSARLTAAIYKRADRRGLQAWGWIQELHRTADALSRRGKAAGADTMTAFWIKLHGVLVEVGGHYDYVCDLAGTSASEDAAIARTVRDALHAVRDSMNEDELIWLSYRRDVECHVWQDGYELSRRGDRLKEARGYKLLGDRQLTHVEFDKRARALLLKFNIDEPAMAVHFAKLVAPHAARLLEIFRTLV